MYNAGTVEGGGGFEPHPMCMGKDDLQEKPPHVFIRNKRHG